MPGSRWPRRVLIAICTSLAAVVALALLLHTPWAQARILAAALARVAPDGSLTAESLSYYLPSLRFDLTALALRSPGRETPYFVADRVRIDLPWSALWGAPAFEYIELQRPRFQVYVDADGNSNFVGEGMRIEGPLRLDRLSISDLQVLWSDDLQDIELRAGAIDVEVLQGDLAASSLRAGEPLRLFYGDIEMLLRHDAGRLGWTGRDLVLSQLALSSAAADLSLDGVVERALSDRVLDLRATAVLRTDELAALVGRGDLDSRGEVRLEATIAGPAQSATVDAVLSAPELWAADVRVDGLRATATGGAAADQGLALEATIAALTSATLTARDLHLRARLDDGIVLEQVGATVAGGMLSASGRVALAPGEASGLRAEWSGMHVDDLWPVQQGGQRVRIGASLAGQAEIAWTGPLPARMEEARAELTATVRPLPGPGLRPSGSLTATLADGGWSASADLDLEGLGRLRGSASSPTLALDGPLRGRLEARLPDLAATAPWLERFTGAPIAGTDADPIAGSARLDADLSGTMGAPRLTGTAGIAALRVADSGSFDATAAFTASADSVSVRDATVDTPGGRVRLEAVLGADGSIDGSIGGEGLQIGALVTALPSAWLPEPPAVTGTGELEIRFRGTLPSPSLEGHVSIAALTIADHPAADVHLALSRAGDATRIDSLVVSSGDSRLRARGLVRAGTRDVELVADLRLRDPARLLGRPELEAVRGIDAEAALALAPDAGSVSVDLWSLAVDLEENDITTVQPAWATWDADGVAVGDLRLRFGDATVSVDGALREDGTGPGLQVGLRGDLSQFESSAMVALQTLRGETAGALTGPLALAGRVQATATITGTLAVPTLAGQLRVEDGRVALGGAPALEDITLALATEGDAVRIQEASLRLAGATVTAAGSVPQAWLFAAPAALEDGPADAAGSSPASLRVRFTDVSAAALAPYLPAERRQDLRLALSGVAELTASRPALVAARGELRLEELQVESSGVRVRQEVPTRLVLEDSRLRIVDWNWLVEADAGGEHSTGLAVSGGIDLSAEDPRLELAARGELRLAVLGPFLPAGAIDGRARLEIDLGGTLSAPRPEGRIVLSEVAARYPSPRLALGDFSGTLHLTRERIFSDGLTGVLNGGDLRLDVDMDISDPALPRGLAGITGRGVALETAGARVSADIDITISAQGSEALRAFGSVTLLEGGYRTRASVARALRQAMADTATLAAVPTTEPGLLDRMQLDVRVRSADSLVFDSPFALLTADLDLRVTGTAARPGVVGRAGLDEGGRVYLGGNTFSVERGVLEFADPSRIQPTIDMMASTRIREYAVTIELSGDAFSPTLEARATAENTPDLGQADTLSLIATGRTMREAGGQGTQVLREQAFAFLTGQLRGVTESLGLGTVRLQQAQTASASGNPFVRSDNTELFPRTTDLATRLTFTRPIGERFELTFSQNLTEAGEASWAGSVDLPWDVDARAGVFDGDTRLLELRHRLVFGNPPEATPGGRRPPRVREVLLEGELLLPEERLRDRLRLEPGDDFDFLDWQRDQDRLLELYRSEGYLEARVRPRRDALGEVAEGERPEAVDLRYEIRPGPATRLRVEGFDLGGSTLERMRRAWSESIALEFLLADLEDIVRRQLIRRGHPRARITVTVASEEPTREIVVVVEPGPRATDMDLAFSGNRALDAGRLRARLELADARQAAWYEPARVVEALEGLYGEEGFLAARVRVEEPEIGAAGARVLVHVEEGPAFRIETLRFVGNRALQEAELRAAVRHGAGSRYTPLAMDEILSDVVGRYLDAGFNSVQVVPVPRAEMEAGTVALELQIEEGAQEILQEVIVEGRHRTRRGVIDRAVETPVGEPIGMQEVERIRRRLYGDGAFRNVDVDLEAMGPAANGRQPVRLRVRLVELPAFELRYGLQVLDLQVAEDRRETKPGLGALITHQNFLGVGARVSLLGRARTDETFGRASLSFLRLFGLPIRSTLIAQQTRRDIARPEPFEPALRSESVLQLQQSVQATAALSVGYSFELERSRTRLPEQPSFGSPTDVTRLIPHAIYDTRDDLLAPASGLFHSSALEMALGALGSDLRFVKYSGYQYAFVPWRGVVFASAARFGAGRSLDPASDALPSRELFLAGGGTTVRGYPDGSLGGTPFFGAVFPGGDAMLILNQEVRFPIFGWIHGVAFLDAGKTFTSLHEIRPGDLALATGAGLRLVSPYGVLRLDYGHPLSSVEGVPDEERGRFHFGIGHIF